MALKTKINRRSVEFEEAYIKAKYVNFAVDIFQNLDKRKNGEKFDHETIRVEMNDKLYKVLKESVFPNANDVNNAWKNPDSNDESIEANETDIEPAIEAKTEEELIEEIGKLDEETTIN